MTETRTNPLTRDVIQRAIEGIDALIFAQIHENYSGRGMTKPCVGVVIHSTRDLLALGASIAHVIGQGAEMPAQEGADHWAGGQEDTLETIDDAIRPLHDAQIDHLGHEAVIVYWPDMPA